MSQPAFAPCPWNMQSESKSKQVAKLTLSGAAFIGLGAVLSVYCPPFKKPVDVIENGLKSTAENLSSVPVFSAVFKENPLTNHPLMSRFLAVSTFETLLAGSVMLLGGAMMKLFGVLPKHLQESVNQQAKDGGAPSR